MQFGEKLKQLRQERNLTQPDLADKLGIEQSWLSKLENDKCHPSSELLDKISQVFGLSLDQLLHDLEPDFVRNHLAALPEVRGLLQQKKYQLVHNAKRWLLAAAMSMTVGITLFIAGKNNLVFNDQMYIYQSPGVLYTSEPEQLYENSNAILSSIASNSINLEPNKSWSEYERAMLPYFKKMELALKQRMDSQQEFGFEYRGDRYKRAEQTKEEAQDIYGNHLSAGAPAYRNFVLTDVREDNTRIGNRLFMLFGILLTATGGLLALVEWRITHLTKRLNY